MREKEKEKKSCVEENRNRRIVNFDETKSNLKNFKLKSRKNCKRR